MAGMNRSTPCAASTASTPAASARCARATSAARSRCPRRACSTSSASAASAPPASSAREPRPRRGLPQPPAQGAASARACCRAKRSAADARASVLSLTAKGRKAFAAARSALARRSLRHARCALRARSGRAGRRDAHRRVAARRRKTTSEIELRAHRPGDLGWVVQAHGELYAGSTAGASASRRWSPGSRRTSSSSFDPPGERCWIAEIDGEPVGSVFVVPESKRVAQLRLLLVDPRARGRGLGRRLVRGVHRVRPRTRATASSCCGRSRTSPRRARSTADCGFELAKSEKHAEFGVKLTGEYWELRRSRAAGS